MDSTFFCNSFAFNIFRLNKYRHNDSSAGAQRNYFAYMIKGRGKLCSENESLDISEGDIFFIPNGCRYHSYWSGEPDIEFISLGFLFLPNFENRYYSIQTVPKSDEAVKLMYSIVNSPLDAENVGRLYTLSGMLLPKMIYKTKSKKINLVERVQRLISSDPERSVRELAKECAVSESSLYTTFKKYSEKSIKDIKKSVIMDRAKVQLISTDDPIEEISWRLNFSSVSYFRKCFKEFFGVSPRELRKRERL